MFFPFGLAFLAASVVWVDVFGVKLLAASVLGSILSAVVYTWRERNTDGAYGILYGVLATTALVDPALRSSDLPKKHPAYADAKTSTRRVCPESTAAVGKKPPVKQPGL